MKTYEKKGIEMAKTVQTTKDKKVFGAFVFLVALFVGVLAFGTALPKANTLLSQSASVLPGMASGIVLIALDLYIESRKKEKWEGQDATMVVAEFLLLATVLALGATSQLPFGLAVYGLSLIGASMIPANSFFMFRSISWSK